ncbi:hypothetical protein UlMin_012400 [Ulmus minor]
MSACVGKSFTYTYNIFTYTCYVQEKVNFLVVHDNQIWRAENASALSLPIFIVQLLVILSITRLLTFTVRPLHIPRIAAEMLGGFLLGPSGIGFTDFATTYLSPFGSIVTMENMANIGLVYFMFMVGLEVDMKPVLRASKKPLGIALAGLILPVPIGFALYHLLFQNFGQPLPRNTPTKYGPLFWGIAIGTTNFPDLARILADLKLLHSDIGRTALTSAVITDLFSWFFFVVTMSIVNSGRLNSFLATVAFVGCCFVIVRPSVKWALRKTTKDENYRQTHVCFILTAHSIVGAFMFGVILPKGELNNTIMEMTEDFVSGLLMPLFFYVIGLRTDRHWMFERNVDIGTILIVIMLAFVAKVFSTFVIAFFVNKMPPKDCLALGLLMNTKGIVALLIISSGREIFALDIQTFTVLVFALWTMTTAVGPILFLTYKAKTQIRQYKYKTIRSIEGNSDLINLLQSSNPSKQSPLVVFAAHLVELVGHASAMLIVHDTCKPNTGRDKQNSDQIVHAFQNLESDNFSVQPLTAVSAYNTMHEDICSLAEDKSVTLIIVPFHIQTGATEGGLETTANSPFHSVNKNVIDNASCSVALFVDRGFIAPSVLSESVSDRVDCSLAMLFISGRDDREALAYAWRMAKGPKMSLTVIRFIPGKNAAEVSPFIQDDDDDDEGGGILNAMVDIEKEKPLDEQYIGEFKLKSKDDPSMRLIEEVVDNGEEVVRMINSLEARYDLFIVGRGKGVISPLTSGLSEWCEYPELGPVGDLLVCLNFATDSSVLVVQQGDGSVDEQEGIGQVREEFGHMTCHPPEMNKYFAPFIHRRVRMTDDDDHL